MKDFWFSTNYEKNKKLLFFSGLSHFTTVINAELTEQNIVLYFEKSQQAETRGEPQPALDQQPIAEVVAEVNLSRKAAFHTLFSNPLRSLT